MSAAGEAHGLGTGGPVEGLGDGRPPVDHDGFLFFVGHAGAPDVIGVVAGVFVCVEPAEHQRAVAELELHQAVGDVALDHLAFPASLLGAALADLDHRAQLFGALTRRIEALVRVVDVGLLSCQFGM